MPRERVARCKTPRWRILAAQERNAPGFEIVLEVSGNGWEATCHHGCNWERLKLVCSEGIQCRTSLMTPAFSPEGLAPKCLPSNQRIDPDERVRCEGSH